MISAANPVYLQGEAVRVAGIAPAAGCGATRWRPPVPGTEGRDHVMEDVVSPSPSRPRPLCYVPRGGCLVETCTRTIHGRPLLRPGPEANERILGVLGRAAEYYHVRIFAFGVASNHYHLLYFAELSPEAYREMVAEVVSEIEEEAAAERGDRPVLGVEKILSQDACQRP